MGISGVIEVEATFDRPCGFLTVHRTSRLALAAGRVTDPEPYREGEDEEEPLSSGPTP
ncbi:hypothetical protein ACIBKX_20305 [Streptomyces sp. NPDC050658]|uniref:hypothetical protein n=1 Tax=Streptomyces sp. NPDC050658 TaxID=3365633 RepID=UPI0037951BF5